MSKPVERKHILIVLVASIMALSYIGFLFLPYFRVYNSQTKQLSYSLTGFTIAIGKSSSGSRIIGSNILLLGEIVGSCGGLLTLVFALLYIFKKNHNGIMYFILGLSVLCIAFAIASIFLSGPIYQANNEVKNRTLIYSVPFYFTCVLTILSFLVNLFIIFYVSFADRKPNRPTNIEK